MKHIKIFLLICFTLQFNTSHAQTIYKYWYSERVNVCMKIKEKGYNSSINEFNKIRFKCKKNDLKVIYRYYRGVFGGREKFTFNVVKLTNDTLILARKPNCTYLEHFRLDSIIVFKSVIKNCYENGMINFVQGRRP